MFRKQYVTKAYAEVIDKGFLPQVLLARGENILSSWGLEQYLRKAEATRSSLKELFVSEKRVYREKKYYFEEDQARKSVWVGETEPLIWIRS